MFEAKVFIATSLDGFIARPNGALDWLPEPKSNEDYGYKRFMTDVDVIVMGRKSFQTVLGFGLWPYEKPVMVMSHSPSAITVPDDIAATVEVTSDDPATLARLLQKRGLHRAYVDGGKTISSFLANGLIAQITLTRVPVLLGQGIPLFSGENSQDIVLTHTKTNAYADGMVQSTYLVQPEG